MAKEKNFKAKKSSADIVINIVITVVIIAVLALAVVAVGNKFKPEIYTVESAATEKGMTVEEFTGEYGLENVQADDKMEDVVGGMTLENYAKFLGMSFEDFKTQSQLPEVVTNETTFDELQAMMEELAALQEQAEALTDEAPAEEAGEEQAAE